MIIRHATTNDLNLLHRVERECFAKDAYTLKQIAFLLEDPNSLSLVALVNEKVVGFIIGQIHDSSGMRIGHVCTLDVVTKYRRKGIGCQLLTKLERLFKEENVKDCFLEVDVENVGALSLYRKHEYTELARLKNYYSKGVDGVRLKKRLAT
ncbi:MAG: GNAT family N-acetyltransferase [Candidatus Bathyarchaeota archaeon]|nr:MAG: GNAT family N-acetyltransferase [Candidatus Bathyarchaeota archaeon]